MKFQNFKHTKQRQQRRNRYADKSFVFNKQPATLGDYGRGDIDAVAEASASCANGAQCVQCACAFAPFKRH